jgi:hypothetical protein
MATETMMWVAVVVGVMTVMPAVGFFCCTGVEIACASASAPSTDALSPRRVTAGRPSVSCGPAEHEQGHSTYRRSTPTHTAATPTGGPRFRTVS